MREVVISTTDVTPVLHIAIDGGRGAEGRVGGYPVMADIDTGNVAIGLRDNVTTARKSRVIVVERSGAGGCSPTDQGRTR